MRIPYILITPLLVMAGGAALANYPQHMRDEPLSDAIYSFPVQDIQQSNNTISFTIRHNAHSYNEKADAVELSGIYTSDHRHASSCPVVDSHFVKKDVRKYNPISGKAKVVATFQDQSIAVKAAKNGCLLIHDVD
jgi:hypothetical protein